ncbi:unnamed protein product [Dibothriocephalus latus]|uniref:Uncharacterized protein n=1 Tax=Dibothriocephalus latus TaxID=60516 RepID=A0A3P7LDV4_DIBLA|nr:unnamed protein product [Dibothriocephalus latus]
MLTAAFCVVLLPLAIKHVIVMAKVEATPAVLTIDGSTNEQIKATFIPTNFCPAEINPTTTSTAAWMSGPSAVILANLALLLFSISSQLMNTPRWDASQCLS